MSAVNVGRQKNVSSHYFLVDRVPLLWNDCGDARSSRPLFCIECGIDSTRTRPPCPTPPPSFCFYFLRDVFGAVSIEFVSFSFRVLVHTVQHHTLEALCVSVR